MTEQVDEPGPASEAIPLGDARGKRTELTDWRRGFESEVDDLFRRRLRVATTVLLILHGLAFLVFPDRTGTRLGSVLRIGLVPFTGLLFASTWWRGMGRAVRAAAALMIVSVSAYAAWNNAAVGDPLDIRALTLTTLTAGLLFPFGEWAMLALSAAVLGIYFIAVRSSGMLGQPALAGTFFLARACMLATLTSWLSTRLRQREFHARHVNESLLRNMLPAPIVARLKLESGAVADRHAEATVMFADIVGFTAMSATTAPEVLVRFLNGLFSDVDALTTKHGLEKIKTIGDAYMAAAGLPVARADHAEAVARFALEMRILVGNRVAPDGKALTLRIGIHSGPVVAGVIGATKLTYDLWGDTVNTASRMESHAEPGSIQVTEATRDLLKGKFRLEPRGAISVKGKGEMKAFVLVDELSKPPSVG